MDNGIYNGNDYLQIATAYNNRVRIYVTKTTNILVEAIKRKEMMATATAALGRTLSATLMMGSMLKGSQSIAVKIDGGGPIGKIVAESEATGKVMGYVENGGVYLKYNNGKLAVGLAVGNEGTLQVIKDLNLKEPFVSSVPLISGEIAEDFTYYFAVSEQVPSSVSLGVLVGLNGEVLASGGFIVQVMPDCDLSVIEKIEQNIKQIKPISELIVSKTKPRDIVKMILGDDDFEVLKVMPVKFECRCSKEKFRDGIKSLGFTSIKKMLDEDHQVEATCHYCGEKYIFDEEELEEILMELD